MTVSEFIRFWDDVNISTIPIQFYYNGTRHLKSKLYSINNPLNKIKIKCEQKDLTKYDTCIYHSLIDSNNFNYDQQKFYNDLHVEIPDNTYVITLNIYIE